MGTFTFVEMNPHCQLKSGHQVWGMFLLTWTFDIFVFSCIVLRGPLEEVESGVVACHIQTLSIFCHSAIVNILTLSVEWGAKNVWCYKQLPRATQPTLKCESLPKEGNDTSLETEPVTMRTSHSNLKIWWSNFCHTSLQVLHTLYVVCHISRKPRGTGINIC